MNTYKILVKDQGGRIILDNLSDGSLSGLNFPLFDNYLREGFTITIERDWELKGANPADIKD